MDQSSQLQVTGNVQTEVQPFNKYLGARLCSRCWQCGDEEGPCSPGGHILEKGWQIQTTNKYRNRIISESKSALKTNENNVQR